MRNQLDRQVIVKYSNNSYADKGKLTMKMTDNLKRAHFLHLAKYGNRLNEDQDLVDSILKSHLEYVPRKKLYKFRTCNEDNFSALENRLIYMSPACKFQDTFDSVIRFNPERCRIDLQKWLRANLNRLAFISFNRIFYMIQVLHMIIL